MSLAVGVGDVGGVETRLCGERPHHGVADQVGEAHLRARCAGQVLVQQRAVDLEELGRDRPDARRGRHPERRLHVGGDAA